MKMRGINRLPLKKAYFMPNLIILERSQGAAPCPSSGGGRISPDTYSACRLAKNTISKPLPERYHASNILFGTPLQ
jgi:hypothetical protein